MQKGIAPLISGIIYSIIALAVTGIVLSVSVPYIENLKDTTEINKAKKTVSEIDSEIQKVASSGKGSTAVIHLNITDEQLQIDSNSDVIKVEKDTSIKIVKNRFRQNQGNIFVCNNCTVNAFAQQTSDANILVLENKRIRIEFLRVDSNTQIPLTNIIRKIILKDNNSQFSGTINFYLDNYSSINNNITTRLAEEGYSIGKGEVEAYISSSYYTASVRFVLESDFDFLLIKIPKEQSVSFK